MSNRAAIPFKVADHYSNILLLAPDGQPLATIPVKRARWYKKKNLVEVIENREGYNEVLRMLVEPAGRPVKGPTPLVNRCVVCGSTDRLSSHHVIPKAIRVHFEAKNKEHASNWCVLVCETHHLAAEKLARSLYEKELQKAVGEAHQLHSRICYDLVKEAIARGEKPGSVDLSAYQEDRKRAVKKAHADCAQKLIEQYGGFEGSKELFKQKFLELKPLYLPAGFLTDDWQR